MFIFLVCSYYFTGGAFAGGAFIGGAFKGGGFVGDASRRFCGGRSNSAADDCAGDAGGVVGEVTGDGAHSIAKKASDMAPTTTPLRWRPAQDGGDRSRNCGQKGCECGRILHTSMVQVIWSMFLHASMVQSTHTHGRSSCVCTMDGLNSGGPLLLIFLYVCIRCTQTWSACVLPMHKRARSFSCASMVDVWL